LEIELKMIKWDIIGLSEVKVGRNVHDLDDFPAGNIYSFAPSRNLKFHLQSDF